MAHPPTYVAGQRASRHRLRVLGGAPWSARPPPADARDSRRFSPFVGAKSLFREVWARPPGCQTELRHAPEAKGRSMSTFANADEVYTYIGGIFEIATKEQSFIDATAGTGLVIKLIQTDPDAVIVIDFPGQKVATGDAAQSMDSTVQLRMSSDNSNRFWQGKLNFTLAMAQRKVKLDGKRSVALKLLPLTTGLFDVYKKLLVDSGREDLLIR
ncbi:SCP2 sterol-binding domain-containing protein [Nocardia sp. R6R-6]|uniref:SCP2 sterol-binding domain-containing protein n=1 Tax=Nocardia sp. R6R-6 TaxID=3459303 RepID=UPI00403D6EBA